MRTTVRLPDSLLRQAKREAQRRGVTFTSLLETGLRHEIAAKKRIRSQRVEIPVFRGGSGTRPGVDITNNAALLDIMDGIR